MNSPKVNFESLKQDYWSEKELKNAEIIADFVQNIMNTHDFDYLIEKYGSHNYTQHNLSIPDGMMGLIEYMRGFVKKFPEYSYDVKLIIADGDYIVFHSHVTTKIKHRNNDKNGFLISDTWRLNDGEIAEHWDAIQPLSGFYRFVTWITGGKRKNNNPLF